MKTMKLVATTMALLLMVCGPVLATVLTADSVTGTGTYNNIEYINDGEFPEEKTYWQINTTWWWTSYGTSSDVAFTFDYGSIYAIEDIVLSVDNNDTYRVEYSLDNTTWSDLFTIYPNYGEIPATPPGGMDTMSTVFGDAEYVSGIDFDTVTAQYLRISGEGSDYLYSIGEFQAHGSPVAPVPEPTTLALSAMGLLGMAGYLRKKALLK